MKTALLLMHFALGMTIALAEPEIAVHMCRPDVPDRIRAANHSFSAIYELTLEGGAVTQVAERKVPEGVGSVTRCFRTWRLNLTTQPDKAHVVLYWEHGVGWAKATITTEGLSLKLSGLAHGYGTPSP